MRLYCGWLMLVVWLGVTDFTSPSSLQGQSEWKSEESLVRPISGSLVIAGGGTLPQEIVDRFLELGGGEQARLVVVTTASVFAGTPEMESRMGFWREKRVASFHVLHTRSREEANDPEFFRPLEEATAVWFVGGNQNWVTDAYLGTRTETKFHEVLQRGGVIGGTSAGAAIMSRVMISGLENSGERPVPLLRSGFGFAPGLIVDQHFRKRNRQDRLVEALCRWPGHVGMGIDEGTALVVRGGTAEVMGDSDVTIVLGEAPGRPTQTASLPAGRTADLTLLGRVAAARVHDRRLERPELRKGTLVLVGSETGEAEIGRQFLSAAGGRDASIVVVCSSSASNEDHVICQWLRTIGASNVKSLAVRSRRDVETAEFVSLVNEARGVWLSDGPLREMIDTYVGSPAQELLTRLLERGGVIGGSAASALLSCAALPAPRITGELEILTEAYERGLGFLPGVAVAQGTADRSSTVDLAGLRSKYPGLIGVELNAASAVVVRGSKMRVMGQCPVAVLDRFPEDAADHPERSLVQPGESYDLCERVRIPAGAVLLGDD